MKNYGNFRTNWLKFWDKFGPIVGAIITIAIFGLTAWGIYVGTKNLPRISYEPQVVTVRAAKVLDTKDGAFYSLYFKTKEGHTASCLVDPYTFHETRVGTQISVIPGGSGWYDLLNVISSS
jgi:hypothetical protein